MTICRLEVTHVRHMRERINAFGYNNAGHYFGIGAPLFRLTLANETGFETTEYVRCMNETQLALHLRRKYPSASLGRRLCARLRALELGALPGRVQERSEAHA